MTIDLIKKFEIECKKQSGSIKEFRKYFIVDDNHIAEGVQKEPIRAGVAKHEIIRRIIHKGILCHHKCKDNPLEIVLAVGFENYPWIDFSSRSKTKERIEEGLIIAYAVIRKKSKKLVVTVRVDTTSELKEIQVERINYEE